MVCITSYGALILDTMSAMYSIFVVTGAVTEDTTFIQEILRDPEEGMLGTIGSLHLPRRALWKTKESEDCEKKIDGDLRIPRCFKTGMMGTPWIPGDSAKGKESIS